MAREREREREECHYISWVVTNEPGPSFVENLIMRI